MKTPTPSALLDPAYEFLEPGAGAARAAGDGEDEPDAGPSGRVKGFLGRTCVGRGLWMRARHGRHGMVGRVPCPSDEAKLSNPHSQPQGDPCILERSCPSSHACSRTLNLFRDSPDARRDSCDISRSQLDYTRLAA